MNRKYCTRTTDAPFGVTEVCNEVATWHVAAKGADGGRYWTAHCDEHAFAAIRMEGAHVLEMHRVGSGCTEGRLKDIAALLHPCPPPDVVNGYDLCPVHPGSSWPCSITKAAWLALGMNINERVREAMADAMFSMNRDGGGVE